MHLPRLLRAFAPSPRVARPSRRLLLEALEARDCPSGGQLDTTFNGTGSKTLPGSTMLSSYDTVVQPDGKIVTVGYVSAGGGKARPAIVRMNANGSMDTTFNGTGQVNLPTAVGSVELAWCHGVAVQPDGKLVVTLAASKQIGKGKNITYDSHLAVARLNANGSVDTSFGTNNGYWFANPDVGTSSREVAMRVAILPGGGIVGSGKAMASDGYLEAFAAFKLTPTGQSDSTFGSGGVTAVHVGTIANVPEGGTLAVTPAGGVILAGSAKVAGATYTQGCIVALTPTGQLDAGFNGVGYLVASTPGGPDMFSYFRGVAMQGSSILVAGYLGTPSPNVASHGIVARYTLSGALDTTFATGGFFIDANPTLRTTFTRIQVAADGSIVVCGTTRYTDSGGEQHGGSQIAHLLADGTADTSFGSAGTGFVTVTTDYTSSNQMSLAIGPDGKILVTVSANDNTPVPVVKLFRFTAW